MHGPQPQPITRNPHKTKQTIQTIQTTAPNGAMAETAKRRVKDGLLKGMMLLTRR